MKRIASIAFIVSLVAAAGAAEEERVFSVTAADAGNLDEACEVNRGIRAFGKGDGAMISSASPGGGYIIWDMQVILPAPGKPQYMLRYSGGKNGPDELRGARWSVSDDSVNWTPVSVNQFDTDVTFSGRFLKLEMRWAQAGDAGYGFLKGFTIRTSAPAAKPAERFQPAPNAPRDRCPQRDPGFLPLGVYWAGEYAFGEYQVPKIRWAKVDKALDDMAAHHVNAIWLTHTGAADAAELARRAAARGIYLAASLSELSCEEAPKRHAKHQAATIAGVLQTWGGAPPPIAWGLGDEPRTGYASEMQLVANAWKQYAPGEPVTTVVMWGDLAAYTPLGFDALCCDVYPFFGTPYGYPMHSADAWTSITERVVNSGSRPWMMGAAFQEIWGPTNFDADGNVIILPGGIWHFQLPTPEQIRWQAWAAFATGAKGMFYFHYRTAASVNPKAEPTKEAGRTEKAIRTGAPFALVHPDGRPSKQYAAMRQAYGKLAKLARVLAPLRRIPAPEAWTQPFDIANVLRDPNTGKRYLMVVALYEGEGNRTVNVTLGPHITGLRSVTSGKEVPLTLQAPFRTAAITLPPGEGELFECTVDETNPPVCYVDAFVDDRYAKVAENGSTAPVKRYPTAGRLGLLSAADGGQTPESACLVFDLDRMLGACPDGVRLLMYEGSTTAENRGAFWSASADGKEFAPLSANEFHKPIVLDQRYVKVGLSWRQAGDAGYGNLSRMAICQWRRAAGE